MLIYLAELGLNFGLGLNLHQFFVFASSIGLGSLCISADSPKHLLLSNAISLFFFILYIPVNIFSVISGQVFLG